MGHQTISWTQNLFMKPTSLETLWLSSFLRALVIPRNVISYRMQQPPQRPPLLRHKPMPHLSSPPLSPHISALRNGETFGYRPSFLSSAESAPTSAAWRGFWESKRRRRRCPKAGFQTLERVWDLKDKIYIQSLDFGNWYVVTTPVSKSQVWDSWEILRLKSQYYS